MCGANPCIWDGGFVWATMYRANPCLWGGEVCVGYSVWSKPLYLWRRSLCGLQCMEQTFLSEKEKFIETTVYGANPCIWDGEVYVGFSVWSKLLLLRWRSLCGLQCTYEANPCIRDGIVGTVWNTVYLANFYAWGGEVFVGYRVWSKPVKLRWRSLWGLHKWKEQTLVSEREQFVWETRVWSKPF